MKTIKCKKILISSLITLLLGIIIVYVFIINRTPVEVLNDNITFTGIGNINPTLPGGMCADYMYYQNYDQVDKRADTVIIGDVIKVDDPKQVVVGKTTNTITGEAEPISYIYTVSEVKVSKVIKGKSLPGDIIKVKQLGGSYKETEYDEHNMYGTVYYQAGDRYLFFLESYENSPSSTINPQQGDMLIKDGKIIARNKIQFVKDNVSENQAVKALKKRVEELKVKNSNKSQSELGD